MSKNAYKIKKRNKRAFKSFLYDHTVLVVMGVIILSCLATLSVIKIFNINIVGSSPDAEAEVSFVTTGRWESLGSNNIPVWLPDELAAFERQNANSVAQVTRDKGGTAEIACGAILVPDCGDLEFDMEADIFGLMDVCRQPLMDTIEEIFGGSAPMISYDLAVLELEDRTYAVEGFGDFQLACGYQDPKDPENTFTEDVFGDMYFNIALHNGNPIICWCVWTWAAPVGLDDCHRYVPDMAVSVSNFTNKINSSPKVMDNSITIEEGSHYDPLLFSEYAPGKYINCFGEKVEELPEGATVKTLDGEIYCADELPESGNFVEDAEDIVEPQYFWDEETQEFVNSDN